ncbi:polyamine aminopropyltransferase [Pseudobdellovibrio exovorus]|uniref:S-adenosylmethionine decarboxylase proenzyme n=1 Tax=Pseudobdellovibrio exovorus JSS TaxID=1184267 RepID=M4VBD6_9BACT|nr:polyamine aminopropyltransferase [Pseudobdellovibrio exovorus]AGH96508.1 spermidine synthase [Pseudobdellovibrio exovorus JSS]
MKALGRHILVEFLNCNADVLNDVTAIENAMVEAAQVAGATVINSTFHHFSPYGVSGVVVIQESHLAIHTWPEYRYAAVDLFTCGDTVDPWVSFEHLKKAFEASYSALEMNRGSTHIIKKDGGIQVKPNDAENYDPKKGYKINRNVWFTDKDDNQALSLRYTGDVLFDERNEFQRVRVLDTISYGKMLTIDDMVMCTERDEYHYHEMISHPAMQSFESANGRPAKNVLVIGGGDGGTIREICKYDGLEKVTMVEIDEAVVRACKQHLPTIASAFDNKKVDLIIGDGIKFVAEATANTYDVIIVDGSDPAGPAEGLFTEEFYNNCKKALKDNGVLVTQGESPMFHSETFVALNKCLKGVFSPAQVHTMLFHATTYPSGMWSLQMAIKGQYHPVKDFKKDAAGTFSTTKGLRYYNEDLHSAAFALPTFVQKMLNT